MINVNGKKNIVLAVLLSGLMVSPFALADYKRGPNFERMAEKLELDESQKSEFISVMNAQREKHKSERESFRQQREAMREQHRNETLSALKGVLSEEQLAEFETHMEQRRHKYDDKRKKHKDCRS